MQDNRLTFRHIDVGVAVPCHDFVRPIADEWVTVRHRTSHHIFDPHPNLTRHRRPEVQSDLPTGRENRYRPEFAFIVGGHCTKPIFLPSRPAHVRRIENRLPAWKLVRVNRP